VLARRRVRTLVQDAAEAIVASDAQLRQLAGVGDRFG
jgi:hypothetical protein